MWGNTSQTFFHHWGSPPCVHYRITYFARSEQLLLKGEHLYAGTHLACTAEVSRAPPACTIIEDTASSISSSNLSAANSSNDPLKSLWHIALRACG